MTYAGMPHVAAACSNQTFNINVTNITPTQFTVAIQEHKSGFSSQETVYWMSLGTKAGDIP